MPKRHSTAGRKYIKEVAKDDSLKAPISMITVAMKVPKIVTHFDTSAIKQQQVKPDWSLYRIEMREGIPFIVREMCDRCGKVKIPVRWRKLRVYHDPDIGEVYLETGICKDCINASVYVDKFLDGDPLSEKDAKELYYKYAEEYERAWRMVLAAAPRIAMTEQEWQHRCKFFGGCALCGGPIEVRAKYFPIYLNGTHSSWNILPLCGVCKSQHYAGRVNSKKTVSRYRVFSTHGFFNKSKTIRMYLMMQMIKHEIYMEPLEPFRERFFEKKILEGSD